MVCWSAPERLQIVLIVLGISGLPPAEASTNLQMPPLASSKVAEATERCHFELQQLLEARGEGSLRAGAPRRSTGTFSWTSCGLLQTRSYGVSSFCCVHPVQLH